MRIFVTVGTELPFDRLVRTIDTWSVTVPQADVFAQIGEARYLPVNIQYSRFLEPPEFSRHFSQADVIIGHAGMGTILTALSFTKPILVMPRRATLSEHRSEHQLATARHMLQLKGVSVAFDEHELVRQLNQLEGIKPGQRISSYASDELIGTLRDFIANPDGGLVPARNIDRPLRTRGDPTTKVPMAADAHQS